MTEEKTGYHKGALETLLKERAELSKMLNIVNSLVEQHAQALEEAGVDVEEYIEDLKNQQQQRASQAKEARKKKDSGSQKRKNRKSADKKTARSSEVSNMLEGENKAKGPIKSGKPTESSKKKKKDENSSDEDSGVDYSFNG